jgi:adenylate cyclase
MAEIRYWPDQKTAAIDRPETILQVSLRAGIPHAHACGGNARCSTCRVLILSGDEHCSPRNEKEQALADRLHFAPELRLACQTVISGDVELRRLVLDAEDVQLTDQQRMGGEPSSIGAEKQVGILFADIRGFTAFAETLPPYDVVHVLNRYFRQVGRAIHKNGGCIDNYMGDGLMALFGLDDGADAALRSVRAGLDMLEAVKTLRPYLEGTYTKSFRIGIGIHFGEVVVGTVGHERMKRTTAIGDSVNFASRIESANKHAGTELLISAATYGAVKDAVVVGKDIRVALAGKSGEYVLYEIVGLR